MYDQKEMQAVILKTAIILQRSHGSSINFTSRSPKWPFWSWALIKGACGFILSIGFAIYSYYLLWPENTSCQGKYSYKRYAQQEIAAVIWVYTSALQQLSTGNSSSSYAIQATSLPYSGLGSNLGACCWLLWWFCLFSILIILLLLVRKNYIII